MITIQNESGMTLHDEILPLIQAHWHEIGAYGEDVPLDPDWQNYAVLEVSGLLHVATARVDGKLVGYCVTLVAPHLHYKSTVFAINDLIYVLPEYRGRAGLKLVLHVLREMRQRKAHSYLFHVKPKYDLLPLMKYLKATKLEELYEVPLWDSQPLL